MEPQNVGNIVAEKATDNVTATAMQGNLSESLLAEMRDLSKKRLFFQRIATCCLAGVFLTVFTACLIVVPKAMTTLTNINNAAVKAGSSLDDIDTMTEDITTATNNLNELVSNNSVKLTDAVFDRFIKRGNFNECDITFSDINRMKKIFKEEKLYYDFLR